MNTSWRRIESFERICPNDNVFTWTKNRGCDTCKEADEQSWLSQLLQANLHSKFESRKSLCSSDLVRPAGLSGLLLRRQKVNRGKRFLFNQRSYNSRLGPILGQHDLTRRHSAGRAASTELNQLTSADMDLF
jgi:hypothetical protein